MKRRKFYRSGVLVPYLIVLIMFLAFSARAGAALNGSAQGTLQQPNSQGNVQPDKVTLCHATGSEGNAYVEITVSANAASDGHGHDGHADDIIPAPPEGCPAVLWPGGVAAAQTEGPEQAQGQSGDQPEQVQDQSGNQLGQVMLCHATGSESNPYVAITVSENATSDGHGHDGHADDIIPAPAEGCPTVLSPGGIATGQAQPTVLATPAFTPVAVASPVCFDWLVYSTNVTGDWEIFRLGGLLDNPTAEPNLTQGIGQDVSDIGPSLSPDRRWITFSSNRDGNWELYLASTDGTTQQRVTHTTAENSDAVWSPSGQSFVFASNRDGNWELYQVDVTSGVETRLTYDAANQVNAFWSPDGTHLLFQSDRNGGVWQIYELNLATLDFWLLGDGLGEDLDPSYSFDGTRIVFRSLRDTNSAIYSMNRDGTGVTRISDPAGRALNPIWSPDDTLIAYQSTLDGDTDIYVYELASGMTRKVTDNAVADYAPTWMCNAPILVFTSDVDGNPNLFSTAALPMAAGPVVVETHATRMTTNESVDLYPVNTPGSSDAGLPGALAQLVGDR